jgi:hypothetical protein
MLGRYRPGGLGEVQRDAVVGLGHEEMGEPGCRRQSEDPRQERRRPPLVTARDDGSRRAADWSPRFGLQLSQVGAEGHRVLLGEVAGGGACHDHGWPVVTAAPRYAPA